MATPDDVESVTIDRASIDTLVEGAVRRALSSNNINNINNNPEDPENGNNNGKLLPLGFFITLPFFLHPTWV